MPDVDRIFNLPEPKYEHFSKPFERTVQPDTAEAIQPEEKRRQLGTPPGQTESGQSVVPGASTPQKKAKSSEPQTQTNTKHSGQKGLDHNTLAQLNEQLKVLNEFIQFEPDKDVGKMVMYIKDAETNETLRQIPMEAVLKIAKQIDEFLKNVQVDQQTPTPKGMLMDERV